VHASCPGRQLARRREPSHESCSNMALCGLPVANLSGGGCSGRSLPVQNEIGEKLFWTRLIYGRVYFPTYSNGLKDIASYLGFKSLPSKLAIQTLFRY
jgi:hypothetical protein